MRNVHQYQTAIIYIYKYTNRKRIERFLFKVKKKLFSISLKNRRYSNSCNFSKNSIVMRICKKKFKALTFYYRMLFCYKRMSIYRKVTNNKRKWKINKLTLDLGLSASAADSCCIFTLAVRQPPVLASCIEIYYCPSFYFLFHKPTPLTEGEKIFYLVFIEMQMYGPRQGSRTLPWAKYQIFLEALFICNNINT